MSLELVVLLLVGVIVLGLLTLASAFVLGMYRGWFSIESVTSTNKGDFRFTVDGDRVHRDPVTEAGTADAANRQQTRGERDGAER